MISFIIDHAGTLLVGLIVLGAVALAFRSVQRNKQRGGCGCGCEGCSQSCASYKD